jgi:hypothetical protein
MEVFSVLDGNDLEPVWDAAESSRSSSEYTGDDGLASEQLRTPPVQSLTLGAVGLC